VTADKAIALIEKLVRVAAPHSGASETERTTAALRACELIALHGLTVTVRTFNPDLRRQPGEYRQRQRQPKPPPQADPFRPSFAAEDTLCGEQSCTEPIFRGERVWRRVKNGQVEYVHADCWAS
jgi:hypothetical protein